MADEKNISFSPESGSEMPENISSSQAAGPQKSEEVSSSKASGPQKSEEVSSSKASGPQKSEEVSSSQAAGPQMSDDHVLIHMLRINRMRMRSLRRETAEMGLKGSMHLILRYLLRHSGASQEEIVSYFALDKTNVARDARSLEERGLILRRPDPGNRRQNQLMLTPSGEEMADRIGIINQQFEERMRREMSAGEWHQLEKLLGRVEENCFLGDLETREEV